MRYRLPPGLCTIRRNDTPARFTGNFFRWIAETPDGRTYCDTRESARAVIANYRTERARLIRLGERAQGRAEFSN